MEKRIFQIKRNLRVARVAGLILATSMLWGCAASITPGGRTAQARPENVPQVTVIVDASSLSGDRLVAFKKHGGAESLVNGVLAELGKTGKQLGPDPTELRVDVTGFRLRSTASGVWFGVMAGADILDVQVSLVSGGKTLKSYKTGVGGVMAGLIKPSAQGRFNGLVKVVSQRIVQEL